MTEGLSQGAPPEFFHKDGHMGASKSTGVAHPGGDDGKSWGTYKETLYEWQRLYMQE